MINKQSIKRFLQPNTRRTMIIILAIALFMTRGLVAFFIPPQYGYLYDIYTNFIAAELLLLPLILVGNLAFEFMLAVGIPDSYAGVMALFLAFLIEVFFLYVLLCLMLALWDRFFKLFGDKAKLYKRVIVLCFVAVFTIQAIVIPGMAYNAVSVEMVSSPSVGLEETYLYNTKLQTLKVRNGSNRATLYRLPDVTMCVRDITSGFVAGYDVAYAYENGRLIGKKEHTRPNVITLSPNSEETISIQSFMGHTVSPWYLEQEEGYRKEFDEFLLLKDAGQNNYNYCANLTGEEISRAEKIKILR